MARFLSNADETRLVAAIQAAEKATSGEIVVVLRKKVTNEDICDAAKALFAEKNLDQTARRNAVLILVAYGQRRLAVLGDEGIDAVTPDDFWDDVVAAIVAGFKAGDHISGLEDGIQRIGEKLRSHFPWQEDDVNELADAIDHDEEGERHDEA